MSVVVANRQRTLKINLSLLKQIAESLLADLKIKSSGLEINLVSAKEMTWLNEKYLQHAGSTDVITFDYGREVPTSPDPEQHASKGNRLKPELQTVQGEIFICADEAVLQARRFRASWQSEIIRYLVHGILHLLGYNDLRLEERRKMKRAENDLLRRMSWRFSLAELGRTDRIGPCKSR